MWVELLFFIARETLGAHTQNIEEYLIRGWSQGHSRVHIAVRIVRTRLLAGGGRGVVVSVCEASGDRVSALLVSSAEAPSPVTLLVPSELLVVPVSHLSAPSTLVDVSGRPPPFASPSVDLLFKATGSVIATAAVLGATLVSLDEACTAAFFFLPRCNL